MALAAQQGTAENGYYPTGYQGDTWTGIVSSLNPANRELTLVYTHKHKTIAFSGVLAKNFRAQAKSDKEKQQVAATGITVGMHLRAFYIPN